MAVLDTNYSVRISIALPHLKHCIAELYYKINPIVHHHTAQSMSRKGGTGGGGWGHPQGAMHMVAVVAGCRNGLVGWANSCLGCTNVVRKRSNEGSLDSEPVFAC